MRGLDHAADGAASPAGQPGGLPAFVGAFGSRLPPWPGSALFAAGLNVALRCRLPDDVLERLSGRSLRISVRDAGVAFDVSWNGKRFVPESVAGQPDLEIAAGAADMMALLRREADPDTLFFGRRLSMQGDTELGLLVKNTLDGLDIDLPPPHPLAVLRWLREQDRQRQAPR